jgi:hypothetical protein
MLDQLGGEGVPFEVFVDEDGLLRRMTMDMNMAIEGEQVSMKMSMDYFDFGVAVNVQAPAAKDVFDATGMLGRRLGRAPEPTTGSPTLSRVAGDTFRSERGRGRARSAWATASSMRCARAVVHAAPARGTS